MKGQHEKAIIELFDTRTGFLGLKTICLETGLTRKQALRVLDRLTRQGYLKQTQTKTLARTKGQGGIPRRDPQWRRAKGQSAQIRAAQKRKPNTARDKIWKAIRIRVIFTVRDLTQLTGCNRYSVIDYIDLLHAHGVIRKLNRSRQGLHWQLIRDNGPCRPVLSEVAKPPTSLEFAVAKAKELGRPRLCKDIGISKTALSRILAGKYPKPEPWLKKIRETYS